jgi:beta-glucosidase
LSYTTFSFSNLQITPSTVNGSQSVQVSATVTNTGQIAGSDVAQLYLGDPSASGEPPRRLAGFQRVNLAPGASAQVSFTITPQDMSWFDDSANGWTQTDGTYGVCVGDSSALSDLPLRARSRCRPPPPPARSLSPRRRGCNPARRRRYRCS